MKPDAYIEYLANPIHWKEKAISLRLSGNAIWNEFMLQLKSAIDPNTKITDNDKFEVACAVLLNSQFLYSLAAECGLKGLLIAEQPQLVHITTASDVSGTVVSVEINKKGEFRFDTHNLEILAEKTGILDETEFQDMREILSYGTYIITWKGRYPVPLANDSDFNRRNTIPSKSFGHYFRDYFDPFLDKIFERIDASK